ncbi:MAG: hypothetical protein ACLRRK_12155 [Parasutterella sp.]
MKFVKVLLPLAAAALIMGTASARDYDGFYGKVEQMPATGNGDWVIGGKTFKADQRTNIDHGAIRRSASVPALRLRAASTAKQLLRF